MDLVIYWQIPPAIPSSLLQRCTFVFKVAKYPSDNRRAVSGRFGEAVPSPLEGESARPR